MKSWKGIFAHVSFNYIAFKPKCSISKFFKNEIFISLESEAHAHRKSLSLP